MVRGRKNFSEPRPFLPPCKVCEEPSTGLHYGVLSCTACKGFFRRSLFRKEPYICMENKLCHVGIANQRRDICTKCRFDKCLAVGMSLEGIIVGRYPRVNKSKYKEEFLKQQQQCHQHQNQQQQHQQQQQPSCSDYNASSQISSSTQINNIDDNSNFDDVTDDDDNDDDHDHGGNNTLIKQFPTYQEFPKQSNDISTSHVTDTSHYKKMTSLQNIPHHHLTGLALRGVVAQSVHPLPPTEINPLTHPHHHHHPHQQTNSINLTTLLPARQTRTMNDSSSRFQLYKLLKQPPPQQTFLSQQQQKQQQQKQQLSTSSINDIVTGRHHNQFHDGSVSSSFDPQPPTASLTQTRLLVSNDSNGSNKESSTTPHQMHSHSTPRSMLQHLHNAITYNRSNKDLVKSEAASCSSLDQAPESESDYSSSKFDDCVEDSCHGYSGKHGKHGNHSNHASDTSDESHFSFVDNEINDHQVSTPICDSDHRGIVDEKDLGKSTCSDQHCDNSRPFKLEYGGDSVATKTIITTTTTIMSAAVVDDSDDKLMSTVPVVDDESSFPAVVVTSNANTFVTSIIKQSNDSEADKIVRTHQNTSVIACDSPTSQIAKRRNGTAEEDDHEDKSKTVPKKSCQTQTHYYDYNNEHKNNMVMKVCYPKVSPTSKPVFMLYKKPDISYYALSVFDRLSLKCHEKNALEPLLKDCYELDNSMKELLLCPYRTQQQQHRKGDETCSALGTKENGGGFVPCAVIKYLSDDIDCKYEHHCGLPDLELEFDKSEVDDMYSELLLKHDRYYGHKSTYMTESDFRMGWEAYYGICQLRDKIHGEMKFVDVDVHYKIMKETGIDIDNRKKYFKFYTSIIEENFIKYIKFFRSIPGFKGLNIMDRMTLLKSCSFLYDNVTTYKGSDLDRGIVINQDTGFTFRLEMALKLMPNDRGLFEKMLSIHASLQTINLSHEEFVVFKALMITFPYPYDALEEPELVAKCHENYHKCMLNLIRKHYSPHEANRRYSKLMAVFQQVNDYRGDVLDHLKEKAAKTTALLEKDESPLYRELFTYIDE